MNPFGRFSALWLAVLLSLSVLPLVLSGCRVFSQPKIASLPTAKPIPVDVGLYLSPEFQSFEYRYQGFKVSGEPGDKKTFALGKTSADLFNQLFQGMFRKAVAVEQRPRLSSRAMKLAGVFEPNIEEFELSKSRDQPRRPQRIWVRLTYRFTLYAPNGRVSVFWVSGRGRSEGRPFATWGKIYNEATDNAIKATREKLITGFREIPEIQRWLESIDYENRG